MPLVRGFPSPLSVAAMSILATLFWLISSLSPAFSSTVLSFTSSSTQFTFSLVCGVSVMFSFASVGKFPLESAIVTSSAGSIDSGFFITVSSFFSSSTSSFDTMAEGFTSSATLFISDLSSSVNISLASSLLIAAISGLLGSDTTSSRLDFTSVSSSCFASIWLAAVGVTSSTLAVTSSTLTGLTSTLVGLTSSLEVCSSNFTSPGQASATSFISSSLLLATLAQLAFLGGGGVCWLD